MVYTEEITFSTKGFNDIIDITQEVKNVVKKSGIKNGIVCISLPGSTGGITTIEYEPGLIQDIKEILEQLAPMNRRYHHDDTWHDGNGYAHIRSALIGTSVTFPILNQDVVLGTWQQIIFIDFDNRPRNRRLVVQIIGE